MFVFTSTHTQNLSMSFVTPFHSASMTSISIFYAKSLPKCPDISGTKDQAFGHKLNFLNCVVGAINAKNAAAIGMISPGNLLV